MFIEIFNAFRIILLGKRRRKEGKKKKRRDKTAEHALVSYADTTPDVRLAKVKVDSDFTAPCNTSILYPADGGNMHCFTAVTACAVLDVLGPPYSDDRPCTYYHDFPFSEFSGNFLTVFHLILRLMVFSTLLK